MTHSPSAHNDNHPDSWAPILAGLIFGGLAGAMAGLLYAPRSGQELRDDLGGACRTLPQRLGNEFTSSQGKARNILDKTRVNLESRVDKVSDSIQAKKMAKAKHREDMATGYDFN